jgi:methyltransferase family protein
MLYRSVYAPVFHVLQHLGWHLTRNHFYSPIPDTRHLPTQRFAEPSSLPGIDLDLEHQAEFLDDVIARFRPEYDAFPGERDPLALNEYWYHNDWFTGIDAAVAWAFVRHYRPKRVLEVGSGMSTRLFARALATNQAGDAFVPRLQSIDPYASDEIRAAHPPLTELITEPVQTMPVAFFEELQSADILFVDSSHVLRAGSDVQFLFIEVLPRLKPGVFVHFHDVFLPFEYPRAWLTDLWRFWTEQYVLAAFLAFNRAFEVVWTSHAMHRSSPARLAAAMNRYDPDAEVAGGSFWIRRVET